MRTDRRPAPPVRLTEPIPPGSRLLHIGVPKTGTTSLQHAAATHRAELLEHGVRYPGREVNHRLAVAALMQRPLGWKGAGASTPPAAAWTRVLAAIEADPERRAFLSHEFGCEATDAQAARFVDELGPERIQVVITLRGFADLLGSSWQQAVKSGDQRGFEDWLRAALAEPSRIATFRRRSDQAAIVDRWCRIAGPDRVTVVIADKRRPALLTEAFEDLLALPRELLTPPPLGGYAANRTLSLPEAELVRRLNRLIRERGYQWARYTQLVREGVVARLQEQRRPGPDEPGTVLPAWAAEVAGRRAEHYAEAIAAAGCRVVGDLSLLTAPVRSATEQPDAGLLPMDAAVEALAGLLSATEGMGAFFEEDVEDDSAALRHGRLARAVARSPRGRRLARSVRASAHLPLGDPAVSVGYRAARQLRRFPRRR